MLPSANTASTAALMSPAHDGSAISWPKANSPGFPQFPRMISPAPDTKEWPFADFPGDPSKPLKPSPPIHPEPADPAARHSAHLQIAAPVDPLQSSPKRPASPPDGAFAAGFFVGAFVKCQFSSTWLPAFW